MTEEMTATGDLVVGFVGLGMMGAPMAACLTKSGFSVRLFDRDAHNLDAAAALSGAPVVSSLAEIGADADIIITMLPTSEIVEKVLFGDSDAIAASLHEGSLIIDMSSGVPAKSIKIAERLGAQGSQFIDAPVSGGVAKARTGELSIMVGGPHEAVDKAMPLLNAMGAMVTATGPVGSGQAMKALNNLVSAGGFLIGIEALLIGKRFGLEPELVVDVLNASTGRNNSTEKKFKQHVLSREFSSGFFLDLMVKDIGIALDIAKNTKTTAPFSALCREMWAGAAATLEPGADHTEIARYCELLAGLKEELK